MIKRFLDWFRVKERLDSVKTEPPFFKEGEIWWCYIGKNIGHEQNGKGDNFSRPVYILKKYNSESFLGLPTTSKMKQGDWYQPLNLNDMKETIILAQGKTMDYKRLDKKIGEASKNQQEDIKKAYMKLHT